jgi:thiosulfate/3-mercaptopyruvate sulfurtransferase
MVLKQIGLLFAAVLLLATSVWAGGYQYINAADLKEDIAQKENGLIVDIQFEDEFSAHHIEGATATYAYPVKSQTDKKKLSTVVEQAKQSTEQVVIVCPRGGGGAKRTYDYLKDEGIAESRLYILEGGQAKWPY